MAGGRWVKRVAVGLGAVVAGAVAVGGVTQATASSLSERRHRPPGRMVDVGGYRLHLDCRGEGPTVVFEAGFGGFSIDWAGLAPHLRGVRACAYDRAGFGWSEAKPGGVRDLREQPEALHALLQAADVPPPYVLVGHSLGGPYVRQFAATYPDEVRGIVLVDASTEDMATRFPPSFLADIEGQLALLGKVKPLMHVGLQRVLRLSVCNDESLPPEQRGIAKSVGYRTKAYYAMHDEGTALVAAAREGYEIPPPRAGVPVAVLTSGDNLKEPETGEIWRELQGELAAISPTSMHEVVDGSSHFIQTDAPERVVAAIDWVLERSA